MTKRIFRAICLVALTVFLASLVLIMGVLYNDFSNMSLAQLHMQTKLAAQGVARQGMEYFQDLSISGYRITWIDSDGTVLYDNELNTAEMENHLEREEVIQARNTGFGESQRYSASLTQRYLYSALRLPDHTVLRLSLSQYSVLALLLDMKQPIALVVLIAITLSILLAISLTRRILQPLNGIDLDHPWSNPGYEEITPLLKRIDSQQQRLRRQEASLCQKQDELNTIVGSMKEGMLLLNQRGIILSINSAAAKLLDLKPGVAGEALLSFPIPLPLREAFTEILAKALQGQQQERVIPFGEECYQLSASPILSQDTVMGTALFFFQVTAKERAEQLRREFTANVSHELKTPLHSISGYAELLMQGLVKREDILPFSEKIYSEAQRMIHLVEDILSLSSLDEREKPTETGEDGYGKEVRQPIDLWEAAQNVIGSLEAEATAAHVSLTLSGESAIISGIAPLICSILYNLCDNAIKYNRAGGSVTVTVKNQLGGAILSVRDTGIGIAPQHQERIFERFYRVDKSHSKQVGGTGLGLSIVKHAVRLHHGTIRVESVLDKGTTIIVTFPHEEEQPPSL